MRFDKLVAKVSEKVIDKFVQEAAKHLKELYIILNDFPEADKANVADLTSKLIEKQEGLNLEKLNLTRLSNNSNKEPSVEENRLINAVVQSDLTKLTDLSFFGKMSWFAHSDTQSRLLNFIEKQSCLKFLDLSEAKLSSETTGRLFTILLKTESL